MGEYLPANPLVFCLAAATGFLILFELQMFIGALSFFTTLNFQMSWTLDMLMRLLAGLVVPLSLLPEAEEDSHEREAALDATLDALRGRFGKNAVIRGKLFKN